MEAIIGLFLFFGVLLAILNWISVPDSEEVKKEETKRIREILEILEKEKR